MDIEWGEQEAKRYSAISNRACKARFPAAVWNAEYRELLAETAALKADRNALQARIDEALATLNRAALLDLDHTSEIREILKGDNDD